MADIHGTKSVRSMAAGRASGKGFEAIVFPEVASAASVHSFALSGRLRSVNNITKCNDDATKGRAVQVTKATRARFKRNAIDARELQNFHWHRVSIDS